MSKWNFHGHIAVPLEWKAKENGIEITADDIEGGQFVETMLKILAIRQKNTLDTGDFERECQLYRDIPASELPLDKVKKLYSQFLRLAGYKEKTPMTASSVLLRCCFICIGVGATLWILQVINPFFTDPKFCALLIMIGAILGVVSAFTDRNKLKIRKAIILFIVAIALTIMCLLIQGFTFEKKAYRLRDYIRDAQKSVEIDYDVTRHYVLDKDQEALQKEYGITYASHEKNYKLVDSLLLINKDKTLSAEEKKEVEETLELLRKMYCPSLFVEIHDILF